MHTPRTASVFCHPRTHTAPAWGLCPFSHLHVDPGGWTGVMNGLVHLPKTHWDTHSPLRQTRANTSTFFAVYLCTSCMGVYASGVVSLSPSAGVVSVVQTCTKTSQRFDFGFSLDLCLYWNWQTCCPPLIRPINIWLLVAPYPPATQYTGFTLNICLNCAPAIDILIDHLPHFSWRYW